MDRKNLTRIQVLALMPIVKTSLGRVQEGGGGGGGGEDTYLKKL